MPTLPRHALIKARRESLGLTQADLATKAKLSIQTIQKAEQQAGRQLEMLTVERLAKALRLRIGDLCTPGEK